MIPIDKRKEIYIRFFVNLNPIRKISRDLNISRDTISKIVNEQRINLKKYDLVNHNNLSELIDLVVDIPQRKKRTVQNYKVTQIHIDIIKELIEDNERNKIFGEKSKTNLELFNDFKFEVKCEDIEPLSYSTFYKLINKIKKTY